MTEQDEFRAVMEQLAREITAGADLRTVQETARAVDEFDRRLRTEQKAFHAYANRVLRGTDSLSADNMQVLSEMVQNADDLDADEIRVVLGPDGLRVGHNGTGLRFGELPLLVVAFATSKDDDADSTGRFGVGLSTVRRLSETWEVHCSPLHVRFHRIDMKSVDPLAATPVLPAEGWTVFRIPAGPNLPDLDRLTAWWDELGTDGLMFLRTVRRVTVWTEEPGQPARLVREFAPRLLPDTATVGALDGRPVVARSVETADGRSWRLYQLDAPAPTHATRRNKATGDTVPIGLALPLHPVDRGMLHARLPVTGFDVAARVSAPFDPLTGRQHLDNSEWNLALAELVADLWEFAVLDVLGTSAPDAWHLVPLGRTQPDAEEIPEVLRDLLVTRARTKVAAALQVACPDGVDRPLSALAVEDSQLTGLLRPAEVARAAQRPAALPEHVRDGAGRWREVLGNWRPTAGLPPELTALAAAQALLDRTGIDADRTVRLAAAVLNTQPYIGTYHLDALHSLVAGDGTRYRPRDPDRPVFVRPGPAGEPTGLAAELGVAVVPDPAYLGPDPAATDWPARHLLDPHDTGAVLRHLANGGASRLPVNEDRTIGDAALRTLQRAFAELPEHQRADLGPSIGRQIRLRGYTHDHRGVRQDQPVRPASAYLPPRLDPRGFAVAAGTAPVLAWVIGAYEGILRTPGHRDDQGPAAFLRALGVADAPRIVPVPQHACDRLRERNGLPAQSPLSTAARDAVLARHGAGYTVDDLMSDDLDLVLVHLTLESDPAERVRRANALLRAVARLGTAGRRRTEAAHRDRTWHARAKVEPLWVWRLRDVAWLPDTAGRLRRPGALRPMTAASTALYGPTDPNYVHQDLQPQLQGELLAVLGVPAEPTPAMIVKRLRHLRGTSKAPDRVTAHQRTEVHMVYTALARWIERAGSDDQRRQHAVRVRQLLSATGTHTDLVLTDLGWRRPAEAFSGPTILRGLRPFVETDPALEPLWAALDIGRPSLAVLVDAVREIAADGVRPTGEREAVLLEALRRTAQLLREPVNRPLPGGLREKLRWLPLWTSAGWAKQPVYTVDRPSVARQLGPLLPMWEPGTKDLLTLAPLVDHCRIVRLEVAAGTVAGAELARPAPDLTERLRRAVPVLRDELARNTASEPVPSEGWEALTTLEVRVLPGLAIVLPLGDGAVTPPLPVHAHLDVATGVLFLSDPGELTMQRGAGQVLAERFPTGRDAVAVHWRAIWEQEDDEPPTAAPLETAAERDRRGREAMSAAVDRRAEAGPSPAPAPQPQPSPAPAVTPPPAPPALPPAPAAAPPLPPRPAAAPPLPAPAAPAVPPPIPAVRPARPPRLVDPQSATSVPRPRPLPAAPTAARAKEDAAMAHLKAFLAAQGRQLEPKNDVKLFGADAVDDTGHYYELKAHGGAAPGQEVLTAAERECAERERDRYSLVVFSHLDRELFAPPVTMQIIRDPLAHLPATELTSYQLSGLNDPDVPCERHLLG